MKQGQGSKRVRGRSNSNSNGNGRRGGGGGGGRQQLFDSNGPSVRIRGNAFQVHEKYVGLARDAMTAGERIAAENYYQHAEHYFRIHSTDLEERNRQQANVQGADGPRRPAVRQPRPAEKSAGNGANGANGAEQPNPPAEVVSTEVESESDGADDGVLRTLQAGNSPENGTGEDADPNANANANANGQDTATGD